MGRTYSGPTPHLSGRTRNQFGPGNEFIWTSYLSGDQGHLVVKGHLERRYYFYKYRHGPFTTGDRLTSIPRELCTNVVYSLFYN